MCGGIPFEIERKFLIEYPDTEWLDSDPNCEKAEITQTYLRSESGTEARIRRLSKNGSAVYFHTVKRKITDIKRIENERSVSEAEYFKLSEDADTGKRQIRKTRYCLSYENQLFEIDIYPFWNDRAIMEIELSDESTEICFPSRIKIIKEVTDDDAYKNASLAATAPDGRYPKL